MADRHFLLTLEDLKAQVSIETDQDDSILRSICWRASKYFEDGTNRSFIPELEQRRYDYPGYGGRGFYSRSQTPAAFDNINLRPVGLNVDNRVLWLHADILQVTELLTKNGATTIAASDYQLAGRRGEYTKSPFNRIELLQSSTSQFEFDGEPRASQYVTGWWGYSEVWPQAIESTPGTVLNTPNFPIGGTILEVANELVDIYGISQAFKTYQYIKINEEWMLIVGINQDAANTKLTVLRGVMGSTEAQHATSDPISVLTIQGDVLEAVAELAVYLYQKKDNTTLDERPIRTPEGTLILPSQWPVTIVQTIKNYQRDKVLV